MRLRDALRLALDRLTQFPGLEHFHFRTDAQRLADRMRRALDGNARLYPVVPGGRRLLRIDRIGRRRIPVAQQLHAFRREPHERGLAAQPLLEIARGGGPVSGQVETARAGHGRVGDLERLDGRDAIRTRRVADGADAVPRAMSKNVNFVVKRNLRPNPPTLEEYFK